MAEPVVGTPAVVEAKAAFFKAYNAAKTGVEKRSADETGYHPSAPFLPQPVAPDHPEVAAAVEAQLRFAAEQEAAELAEAAASSRSETIAAPLAGYNGY